MKNELLRGLVVFLALVFAALPSNAAGWQTLSGHVPAAVAKLQLRSTGNVPAGERLNLAIGLPLRNQAEMKMLLRQIYDPTSPNYRHYLTPAQFTERFSPSREDYQAVVNFVKSNGWNVAEADEARMLVSATASVADVERALHVTMRVYPHPQEARTFFAPDTEPSLDLATPVLDIQGLNNYALPRPGGLKKGGGTPRSGAGTGPGGTLMGYDFRNAYAPRVTLDGTGQTVALVEFDGFFTNDIVTYESQSDLPYVPITVETVGAFDGSPSTNTDSVGEVSLDMEMVIAMAPGISNLVVYETGNFNLANQMLLRIANDNTASQISSSWFFDSNETTDNYFQRFALQGQSYFECAGDADAFPNGVFFEDHAGPPSDSAYVTSVGGTTLTVSQNGFWAAETVWNNSISGTGANGTGGGISTNYTIPSWQTGTSMAANGGSGTMRNFPDVAMAADNIWVIANNGDAGWYWGTSCAAPLWAGFAALANQQANLSGNPPIGFINPAIYSIGNSVGYTAAFHDITTGNNTNTISPTNFYAVAGYDLCTGWGSPSGMNLINLLAVADPMAISPALGFAAAGGAGGPFGPISETFVLTNSGAAALAWSTSSDSSLVTISPPKGSLPPKTATNVTVSLAPGVTNLPIGVYQANVTFTDVTLGTGQLRQFTVQCGVPLITFDDLTGTNVGEVTAGYHGLNWSNLYFDNALNDLDDRPSGYQAGLVSPPNDVYSGGSKPAGINAVYPFDLISASLTGAWANNLNLEAKGYSGTNLLYDQTFILSATAPTSVQFDYYGITAVVFTTSGGTHNPGYNGTGKNFVMDDVWIVPHTAPGVAPLVQPPIQSNGAFAFNWSAQIGNSYQVQYTTNLAQPTWVNLGHAVVATNTVLTVSDLPNDPQRFYRLQLLP